MSSILREKEFPSRRPLGIHRFAASLPCATEHRNAIKDRHAWSEAISSLLRSNSVTLAGGESREKRRVRSEPAGYELCEQPHALRLMRVALREKPERSVHVRGGARHPHQ